MEETAWEEAERQRVTEEKERKRRTIEYLQQLWDKVLEKRPPYWRGLKNPRLWGPSTKTLLPETRRGNSPLRRLKGSNQGSTTEVP